MTKLFWVLHLFIGAVSFHNFYVSTTYNDFVPDENLCRSQPKFSLMILNRFFSKMGMKTKLIPEVSQQEIDILVEDYLRKYNFQSSRKNY